jgi:hypothetical protein
MFKMTLLVCALAFALAPSSTSGRSTQGEPCPNSIPHEPVVIYEITGGTLASTVDRSLVVYNDGFARLSSAEDNGCPGRAQVAQVAPVAVKQLAQDLAQAGAFALCDATSVVTDVPLNTLTVCGGGTETVSHTFSWWLAPQTPYERAEQILQDFLAANFPEF